MVRHSGKEKSRQLKAERAARSVRASSSALPTWDANKMAEARRRLGTAALEQLNAPLLQNSSVSDSSFASGPITNCHHLSSPATSSHDQSSKVPVADDVKLNHSRLSSGTSSVKSSRNTPAPINNGLELEAPLKPHTLITPRSRRRHQTPSHSSKRACVNGGGHLMDMLDDDAKGRLGSHASANDWLEAVATLHGSEKFLLAQIDRRTEIESSDLHTLSKLQLTVHSIDPDGSSDHRSLLLSFQGDLFSPARAWLDKIVTANGGPDSPVPLRIIVSGWAAAVVAHDDHVYFQRHALFPGRACLAYFRVQWPDTVIDWFDYPAKEDSAVVYASDAAAWAALGRSVPQERPLPSPSTSDPETSSKNAAASTALFRRISQADLDEFARCSSPEFNFDTPQNSGRLIDAPAPASRQTPSPTDSPKYHNVSNIEPTGSAKRMTQPAQRRDSNVVPFQFPDSKLGTESLFQGTLGPLQNDVEMKPFDLAGTVYTPLSQLRRHTRVNLIAVVESCNEIVRAQGGSRDFSITIQVLDNSLADRLVSVQMWRRNDKDLPRRLKSGDVVIARDAYVKLNTVASTESLQVTLFSKSERRSSSNSWAVLSVAPDGELAWHQSSESALHEEEKVYAMRLALWGRETLAKQEENEGTAQLRRHRMLVTIDQIKDSLFCDLAVECIGFEGDDPFSGDAPKLLVTDYCTNPYLEKRDDQLLYRYVTEGLPPPDSLQALTDGIGGGRVLKVRMYSGSHCARFVTDAGKFLHLRNVRCRTSREPMLEATVGNTNLMQNDNQIYVDVLPIDTDRESIQALNARKREYISQLKAETLYRGGFDEAPSSSRPLAEQPAPRANDTPALALRRIQQPTSNQANERVSPPVLPHTSRASKVPSWDHGQALGRREEHPVGSKPRLTSQPALASAASFRNSRSDARSKRRRLSSNLPLNPQNEGVLDRIESISGLEDHFCSSQARSSS